MAEENPLQEALNAELKRRHENPTPGEAARERELLRIQNR